MRAFVYLRQSLDRTGAGAAVDRQREDCLKLCADRGWDPVQVFVDNDVSASSRKPRPAYTKMLAAIERGEADVVVAWHIDRLTRKLTDLEHLIDLTQNTGLHVVTINGDIDLSNDSGRLVGRILASVARGEVERKGARQKRAQQQAAEEGRPAGGRRAFGYESDGQTIRESEAAYLRAAYTDLVHGASLKSISRRWNDAGALTSAGNEWNHSTVRRTLKNPRYAGLRTYRGEVVGDATWPALIDRETFEAAQALIAMPGRRTTTNTARKYLLPSLALCWKCGSDVATGHTRHGKRVYVCRRNKCISRKADPVDALIAGGDIDGVHVRGLVVERLSRPDAADLLSDPSEDDSVRVARVQADAVRQRLEDLATGLEEGLLTLNAVRKSSERLHAELNALEATISAGVRVDVLRPLVGAADVETAWNGYDLAQRRQVIDALMVITLLRPERGVRAFDPESVQIEWKATT